DALGFHQSEPFQPPVPPGLRRDARRGRRACAIPCRRRIDCAPCGHSPFSARLVATFVTRFAGARHRVKDIETRGQARRGHAADNAGMDRPSTLIAATRCNAALDALLNCAAEGIFGLDRLGRCTFCNASAARMLGYDSPAELVGQRMHSLIHAMREDGSPCVAAQCAMNRAFLEHRSAHDDTAYMWRRGGSAFPVEYWTAPLLENGTVVGTVVSFIDITERKASAHALQH